jgi:arylsulfatase A-like enzyme
VNILLIISDTCRRDYLGCYGNPSIHTPHLDRVARESTVFDRCYAASFPTIPNRSDILTGKYNFTYLGWSPMPQGEVTLPRLLGEAGYLTGAVVDTPFYVRNGYGYDQGFDDFEWVRGQGLSHERVYQEAVRQRRSEEDHFAPKTMRVAERWLEEHRKEKFFLLVDTWDPHEPWDPPAHYVELYKDDYDGQPSVMPPYWDWRDAGLTEDDLQTARAHYCGEVTMVDRAVGRLLERLESLAILDETIVIFTSDHGFYLGEHGILGKGLIERGGEETVWLRCPLYDEVTRIPLIIRTPEASGRRVESLVTSPDLMPTILELAGVPIPDVVQSASLLPLLEGGEASLHDIVVTSWPLHDLYFKLRVVDDVARTTTELLPTTVTDGRWTLVYSVQGAPVELYDSSADPKQESNVFEGNEGVARGLHARLLHFLETVGAAEHYLEPRRQLL